MIGDVVDTQRNSRRGVVIMAIQASKRIPSALRLLDKLIADLSAIVRQAEAKGDPMLVDLQRARRRAQQARRILKRSDRSVVGTMLVDSVAFVIAVAQKVYSLLHNCFHSLLPARSFSTRLPPLSFSHPSLPIR